MSAYRWPGQSPSTSEGVLGSDSTPRASASRRAGSTVTTQARRPARAAASAKVADTVVLPTPPEPQHTTTDRSATRRGKVVGTGPVSPSGAPAPLEPAVVLTTLPRARAPPPPPPGQQPAPGSAPARWNPPRAPAPRGG